MASKTHSNRLRLAALLLIFSVVCAFLVFSRGVNQTSQAEPRPQSEKNSALPAPPEEQNQAANTAEKQDQAPVTPVSPVTADEQNPAPGTAETRPRPAGIELEIAEIPWAQVRIGLDLAELGIVKSLQDGQNRISITQMPQGAQAGLVILRVDPNLYEFTLHMASEDGKLRSLQEHAQTNNLLAVINAGMYLPDNLTSTGFMQSSSHINNPRIASRYGAFFMAGPDDPALPQAAVREREELETSLEELIGHYAITVQNLRLFGSNAKVLWPESGNTHSISAMADDAEGNLLLILCRAALSPADFSRVLLELPLSCRVAMYLEGGGQAGLLVKFPQGGMAEKVWRGKRNSFIPMEGPSNAALPNVIGLRPRQP